MVYSALLLWALRGLAQETISTNGTFDLGGTGWTLSGGANIVASSEPGDNPFGRVPDGPLVFLYQKLDDPAPQFQVSFDYFTGLVSPTFPSPGGFPDTAFATVYFGETDAGLRPELLQSGASFALFDFDAVNGLRNAPQTAIFMSSPERSGWTRFSTTFDSVEGQPFFAVTFQTLNANGTAGDSAFLVDNLRVMAVPEPAVGAVVLAGAIILFLRQKFSKDSTRVVPESRTAQVEARWRTKRQRPLERHDQI